MAGLEQRIVLECIENEWITPVEPQAASLDEEDIARLRLIFELRSDFGVNDEAIPIILHLLDQLLHLQDQVRKNGLNS